jgi:hypothetical protein
VAEGSWRGPVFLTALLPSAPAPHHWCWLLPCPPPHAAPPPPPCITDVACCIGGCMAGASMDVCSRGGAYICLSVSSYLLNGVRLPPPFPPHTFG